MNANNSGYGCFTVLNDFMVRGNNFSGEKLYIKIHTHIDINCE